MKVLSAIVAFFLALAAPAAAAPRLVAPSESVGNPAFAGNEIVYSAGAVKGRTEVRAVPPDGTSRVLHTFGFGTLPPDPWDDGSGYSEQLDIELRGSAEALGVHVLRRSASRYDASESNVVVGGPTGGALGELTRSCNGQYAGHPALDADGPRLAFVKETCATSAARHVVVSDVRSGAETNGPATATREVRLAGRYLAYRPAGRPKTVEIYDVEASRVVKAVDGVEGRFDIQADGTVAYGRGGTEQCPMGVRWQSLDSDTVHSAAGCEWSLAAIDDGHIAVWRTNFDEGALAVVPLRGQARSIPLPGALAAEPDLDGNRVVFTTRGCSSDTGGVWIDDGADAPPTPTQPQCAVRLGSATLRRSRKGVVNVPVTCPTGCRGSIEVRGGRRYGEWFKEPFGPGDMFEAAAGQTVHVPMKLDEMPRRYRGRTIKVRVAVRINQRINPNRVVGAVKYLKLRA